jgi:hypothetical protein
MDVLAGVWTGKGGPSRVRFRANRTLKRHRRMTESDHMRQRLPILL